jgi:hypothetical protein
MPNPYDFRWLPSLADQQLAGLPSGDSAEAVVRGDASAIPAALFHTIGRAGLIGVSLAVAGMPADRKLVRYSLASALGIEAFVLVWSWWNKDKKS